MSEVLSVETSVSVPSGPSAAEVEALSALVPDPGAAPTGVDVGTAVTSTKAEETTEAAPAEEAKPAEPAKAEPQVDTEALERAEAAAKKAREGSRRYREMLEKTQREEQQRLAVQREAERLRAEAEEARRLRETLTKDPYKALKDLGMTDQQLAERALREGTPEQAIHEVKQLLEAERQRREALEQRLQQERQEAAARQAEANFARIADNDTAYPRLAQLNTKAQLVVAKAALEQIAENGYDVAGLTDEQVAEACERFLSPKKSAKAAAKPAAAPAPAAKPSPAVKTLTNAVATEKATATREWEELTDDEKIAQIAAMLPDPT